MKKRSFELLGLSVMILVCLLQGSGCNKKSATQAGSWDTWGMDADSLSFLVVGDWGRSGGGAQIPVAAAMDSCSRKFHAQFIIATGDNFYPSGVTSIRDSQWVNSFENVYNKAGHYVPWYPVLGNHDYGSNPEAEILYSSVSRRWVMPARYYAIKKSIGATRSALFVFTDTSPFEPAYYGTSMSDLSLQDTAAQLNWLRQSLEPSTDSWKIVIGHHPLYSVGVHANTPELIRRFHPVFTQTQVDFYLCGHDHSLQYLSLANDPVHYLVSGGGSENTPVSPQAYSPFAQSSPGLLVMTLYARRANFYFYNQNCELLYREQIRK